jgi:predicted nuclease of predicted toxin-antitoxin system
MNLALYMDEHVHMAITIGLRFRDVDVLTVQEDDRAGTPDPLLLDRATELGRVIFSQDQDFLVEAQHRQTEGINFSGVIFARQSRVSIGDCIRDLEIIAKVGNLADFTNRVQFLPL